MSWDAPAVEPEDDGLLELIARAEGRTRADLPALSSFQRQMDAYRPITDEAEILSLLQAHRLGREAAAIISEDGPSYELERLVLRGQDAVATLSGSMFKLTMLIAREQAEARFGRERTVDLLPDLVAEANVALVEAIDSYNPDRPNRPAFSVYAGRAVRDKVRAALARDNMVDVPASWTRIKRIASVRIPALTSDLGRPPTTAEIQADLMERCLEWAMERLEEAQLSLPPAEQREAALAKLRRQGMLAAVAQIEDVLVKTRAVTSLDTPLGDDGGATIGDNLADDPSAGSDLLDRVELGALRDLLREALAPLPEREREIVLLRFGFVDGECWTFEKIRGRYGVTAERIRQIERSVLGKLRDGAHGDDLRGFLFNS